MLHPARRVAALCAVLACCAIYTPARADLDMDAKAKSVAQSLVIVDFTLRNENVSREGSGQGILLNKDGVVLIADSLISENFPKEWISEIKVRPAGQKFRTRPRHIPGPYPQPAFRLHQNRQTGGSPAF